MSRRWKEMKIIFLISDDFVGWSLLDFCVDFSIFCTLCSVMELPKTCFLDVYSTCFFVLDCCELRMRDVGTRLRISCWAYEKVSLGLSSCALQFATYLNDQLNYSLARLRLTGQAPFQHWLLVVLPTNGMSCKFPSWKFRREREREREREAKHVDCDGNSIGWLMLKTPSILSMAEKSA